MLATGILLGPHVFHLLDPSILAISSDLRQIALVIILLKAGLSLDPADLKRVGRPAILMTFLPASFEIIAYTILAPRFLGVSTIEAALMGSVLAAVSPAVVVPRMVKLMDTGYGTEKAFRNSSWRARPVTIFLSLCSFLHLREWRKAAM